VCPRLQPRRRISSANHVFLVTFIASAHHSIFSSSRVLNTLPRIVFLLESDNLKRRTLKPSLLSLCIICIFSFPNRSHVTKSVVFYIHLWTTPSSILYLFAKVWRKCLGFRRQTLFFKKECRVIFVPVIIFVENRRHVSFLSLSLSLSRKRVQHVIVLF